MAQLTGLFTLGRDAETRVTQNGTTVITLAVAYNYGRKGDDGKKPSQWVRASMFGKQAEALIPYLTKGKQVSLVIRDLHIATFQKQDGSTGTSLGNARQQWRARIETNMRLQKIYAPAKRPPAMAGAD